MAAEGGTTTAGVSTSDTHCGRAQREETNYACHDSYIHIIVGTVCAVALYGVEIRYKSVWTICPSTINLFCHFPLLICHQKFLFLPNCPNDECAHMQMHTSSHNAAILLPNVVQTL